MGAVNKGLQKRSPVEQAALAVRILDGRHMQDVLQRLKDELGEAALSLGPLDITRNPLRSAVLRLATAYRRPPMVSPLVPAFAALWGDYSASVTVEKYAKGKGRPMPTGLLRGAEEALVYRLGAGWTGTLLGWSDRAGQIIVQAVSPDDLEVLFASDDPTEPTVIRHRRMRQPLGAGAMEEAVDEYDLSDVGNPVFRVMRASVAGNGAQYDATDRYLEGGYSGDAYPWRYADGTPFHRIVISGDPRQPYRTNSLVEGTLRVSVLWTHWAAAVRDAGHPLRAVEGLRAVGAGSDQASGQAGIALRPGDVLQFESTNPDRPGQFFQFGPGFDPSITGASIREYEAALMQHLGVPTSMEQTGGAPTDLEHEQLQEAIAATYGECRRHDGEVLRRGAAIANSHGEKGKSAHSEGPYAVLYGDEVIAALGPMEADTTDAEEGAENGRSNTGRGNAGTDRGNASQSDGAGAKG